MNGQIAVRAARLREVVKSRMGGTGWYICCMDTTAVYWLYDYGRFHSVHLELLVR